MGRKSDYDPKIASEICERISNGESLRAICASAPKFPAVSTICGWVLDDREGFADQYARARKLQAELLADELFGIADDGSNDTYTDKDGNVRANQDVINRSRLRVDTRKWYLSKVLPKIYGDKLDLNHSGELGIKTVLVSAPAKAAIDARPARKPDFG